MKRARKEENSNNNNNRPIEVLSRSEATKRLKENYAQPTQKHELYAFYSSVLNGITTDADLMSVPIDDHSFVRGHCVFDTANIVNGKCYGLTFHLERLLTSARAARIFDNNSHENNAYLSDLENLRAIVLKTIAASKRQNEIAVRYWMSSGRGDFAITPYNLKGPNFFVIVHSKPDNPAQVVNGVSEVAVSIPLKPKLLATTKSNNYMINCLAAMEAKDKGGSLGLQLDSEGNAAETSIGSIGFVGKDHILRTPKQDIILRSLSVIRCFEMWDKVKQTSQLKGFEFTKCDSSVMDNAMEVIAFGGGVVAPIVNFNSRIVGDGKPGVYFKMFHEMLEQDATKGEFVDDIPYLY